MLETKTGSHPIYIGPGVLHKQKSSYYVLPSLMVRHHPGTKNIPVYGTDGEVNISNALTSIFPNAVHLRCDIHLKGNIKHKLSSLNINKSAVREITADCDLEDACEGRLVDCTSENEFEQFIEKVKGK
jgi:transposase-like protein